MYIECGFLKTTNVDLFLEILIFTIKSFKILLKLKIIYYVGISYIL